MPNLHDRDRTNSYWKTKYPKLVKKGTCKPQMVCRNPVNIAGVKKNGQRVAQGNQTYGKELTEEELLKEHNQNKQLTQILL
jgi:hypothetical protein